MKPPNSRIDVISITTLEWRVNFLLCFFILSIISFNTMNPSPPKTKRPITVRFMRGSPLKEPRLLAKDENPALQKADTE